MSTISFQIREELLAIQPAVHGALDYEELTQHGITPEDVIDFSENSNPFGPSPAVHDAIAMADPARYPDRDCIALRHALADHVGCSLENIMVGNGAAELIWLLGFAFIQRNDPVMIVGPTFGEYERTAQLMGAQVIEWRSQEHDDFQVDVAALSQTLQTHAPRIFFLCNPNNPTGTIIAQSAIKAWAAAHPQTLFVIDEAYIDFAPGMVSAYELRLPNVLILRSMTKAYALAGLRLGYVLGPQPLIAALSQVRIPWSVNGFAQAAGVAALADQDHLHQSLRELMDAKVEFCDQLSAIGFTPLPSATHYLLANVGERASDFRAQLLPQGIIVRDCASFGLPNYIRLATRRPVENQRFITCLQNL